MCSTKSLAPKTGQQVRRTGTFDLECDADAVFPLFSPEGEREWVSGWDPKPVFPEQIAFERDIVFREGAPEAVWTIVDVDWRTHRVEYVRLAPTSHCAHIVVSVEPIGSRRCRVIVTYTVTLFGDDQAPLLKSFREDAYAAKMSDWRQRITKCLSHRNGGL